MPISVIKHTRTKDEPWNAFRLSSFTCNERKKGRLYSLLTTGLLLFSWMGFDVYKTQHDCSAIYGTSCWLIGWRSRDPDKIPSFHCLSLDRITDWMAQPFYINRYKKCSLIIYVELLCSYLYMTVAFLSEKIYTRLYRLLTSIMELKFLLSNFQRISLEQSFDTNVITVLYKADTSNFHREDF